MGLLELPAHLFLAVIGKLELMYVGAVDDITRILAVDHLGPLGRQQLVEGALILRTRLTVDRDEKGLVPQRIYVLIEVVRDELSHLRHAAVRAEEGAQSNCSLKYLVEFIDVSDGLIGRKVVELLV